MKNVAQSNSLLDELFHHITSHPKNLLVFVLLISGLLYSTLAVLISFPIGLLIRLTRAPFWVVSVLGIVLIGVTWLWNGVSFSVLHQYNRLLWSIAFHDNFRVLHSLSMWLCALPSGILLGSVLAGLTQLSSTLQDQIKRTAKGKLAPQQPQISSRRLQ